MCLCCEVCLTPNTRAKDLRTFSLPSSPNFCLAAAPGLTKASPTRGAPVTGLAKAQLLAAVRKVFSAQPRTQLISEEGDTLTFVQRTYTVRFPDTIWVTVADKDSGSALIMYSASKYGHGDLGVNRARVDSWISQLEAELTGDGTMSSQPRTTDHGTAYLGP